MATTAMNTYSFSILVKEGIHPPVTRRVNGEEVFPGHVVTAEGHTSSDCALMDALGDSALGVAGLLQTHDIGTVYADNTDIPVYRCGSGAQVRVYHDGASGGACTDSDIMVGTSIGAVGHVRSLKKAMGDALVDDPTNTVLATAIEHFFSLVGRAMETIASTGTTVPMVIMLSI